MLVHPTRRDVLKALGLTATACTGSAQSITRTYSFWVFGLLKPSELRISGFRQSRLHCYTSSGERILEAGGNFPITPASVPVRVAGPGDAPVHFILQAKNLRRMYYGTLEIRSQTGIFIPVVTMDREIAVSSIASAELPRLATGPEALAAQAVVARSFLTATLAPRHPEAFFCDTTHCQFLRSPPEQNTAAALAVAATERIVLASGKNVFPAAYSAACGGSTESGQRDGYLYESVPCQICRQRGAPRRGHGWGLCQEGAMGLAQLGCSWRAIVKTYFPSATLQAL